MINVHSQDVCVDEVDGETQGSELSSGAVAGISRDGVQGARGLQPGNGKDNSENSIWGRAQGSKAGRERGTGVGEREKLPARPGPGLFGCQQ